LLELVASGLLNKEIAAALGLAEKTVRNQLTRVFEKLGVATRTEAALWFEKRRTVKL
jgi:DNA-binding NarL/FixJ family response regulator